MTKNVDAAWNKSKQNMAGLSAAANETAKSAETSHNLVRDIDHIAKLFSRAVDLAEKELGAKENGIWCARDVRAAQKTLEEALGAATEELSSYATSTATRTGSP